MTTTSRVEVAEDDVQPDPAGLVALVKNYLDDQYDAMVLGEEAIADGRLELVHPTRVASRRYRTVLRDMGNLFDPATAVVLEESLRWYAAVLGDVRDLQVARDELGQALGRLPEELVLGEVAEAVDAFLAGRLRAAETALQTALTTNRYQAMIRQLRLWHDDLPVEGEEDDEVVGRYVRRARKRLERRLGTAAEAGHPLELVHDARKAAKRARYLAELAEPVLGAKAKATVKQMTAVQDDLGGHQDQALARRLLLDLARAQDEAAPPDPRVGFTLGLLYALLTSPPELDHLRLPAT